MDRYIPDRIGGRIKSCHVIRRQRDGAVEPFTTKYLIFRMHTHCSPNTLKRCAGSLSYYLTFLSEKEMDFKEVTELRFTEQHEHFMEFLLWLRAGKHVSRNRREVPRNDTCNKYLQDVFGFYRYLFRQYDNMNSLRVLSERRVSFTNEKGVHFTTNCSTFRGYLRAEQHTGRTISEDRILTLLEYSTNIRDKLLLLLLAETGFRIGEILGLRYLRDIDYEKKTLYVRFRENNENRSRAKYAEERHMKISDATFEILCFYISSYRDLLKNTEYLFVILTGENTGKPLGIDAVYARLRALEKKTGIRATPHMLRHYFANERRKSGWPLLLISKALGHRNIETTEKYLNIEESELEEAADAFYAANAALMDVSALL